MSQMTTNMYCLSLSQSRPSSAPGSVNYKKGCTRLAIASDKVYQLLVHGRWFSPGTPASSTTKTGSHDIADILLKVALNTKNPKIQNLPRKTYHRILNKGNMMGVTSGEGTSGAPDFTQLASCCSFFLCSILSTIVCLFVLFWSLYYLPFFDLRSLITIFGIFNFFYY